MSVSNTPLTSTAIVATTHDPTSSSGVPLILLGDEQHSLISLLLICFAASLMIIATLIGNALIMLAVLLVRKLKQPANFLLVSLAFADFCVGLVVMPLALVDLIAEHWVLGEALCRLWTSADQTLCTASIINLCMISVDRYCAVSRPLRYAAQRTRRRIFCYVMIVWIVALIVSISPLVMWPAKRIEGTCQVNQNAVYQIYATTIAFYGPTMIMIILYVKMWLAAKRLTDQDRIAKKSINGSDRETSRNRKTHRPSTILQKIPLVHNGRAQERGEGKARKTLGAIMSVFICCWVPFFLLALLKPYGVMPPRWFDHLALWLGYSNSLLNPLIYCKYNREFRVPFREMLCCRFRTLQSVMRKESFTSKFGPTRRRTTESAHIPAENSSTV
uniref:5-hydroxytryptamine receptor 7 n=2 Tax=Ascaris TaxID=6251 RepID=F1L3L2_ASCSU